MSFLHADLRAAVQHAPIAAREKWVLLRALAAGRIDDACAEQLVAVLRQPCAPSDADAAAAYKQALVAWHAELDRLTHETLPQMRRDAEEKSREDDVAVAAHIFDDL